MNRFFVKPEFAEQFETRIKNRPQQVDQKPGFVRAQLLRPENAADPYIVLTIWESQAHFEAWVKADTFTTSHAGPRTLSSDIFVQPNKVEAFEVAG